MLKRNQISNRQQVTLVCLEDLVEKNHILRIIDEIMDWNFIYDLVQDSYSPYLGRPSIDPVVYFKTFLIQYLYGISSLRKTL